MTMMKSNARRTLMKAVCLVSLTFQNAAFVQIYKYSRLGVQEDLYIASTAVCVAEVIKMVFSFFLMVTFEKSFNDVGAFFYASVVRKPTDTLRMCVPAVTYVVMTNLAYVSGAHLDVITYQIISQLKIPATVFFSIVFLRAHFRKLQYVSVAVLMAGAVIVQSTDIENTTPAATASSQQSASPSLPLPPHQPHVNHLARLLSPSDKTLGIATGVAVSVLSGFSGVYFEKILKSTEASVWSRNVQLSILSIPPALVGSYVKDWQEIAKKGFFHGYNYVVWTVIFLQACGGLIVALSVKLTNNVSKGYATAASIIVAGVSSAVIFRYRFNYEFLCGAALVLVSMPLYTIAFGEEKLVKPAKLDAKDGECYI